MIRLGVVIEEGDVDGVDVNPRFEVYAFVSPIPLEEDVFRFVYLFTPSIEDSDVEELYSVFIAEDFI